MELFGSFVEGLLDGEGVVVCDMEGEVAGFAVECRIATVAEAFGVVEDDGGILVRDARIEPGETATGEFYFGGADFGEERVRGGDIALQFALDLFDVFFEGDDEGREERSALSGCDLQLML